ncbi:Nif3-like dinuclear metal center hexameric protein [Caldichromatium japonicum]|uniref:Nif3-like dinuclear metal center hexameric protein n=1 Tax=Caldichromatium japonicum TaxID=2699430 RepID=A0A6G7VGR1_9GAMM|nr:Nif3-like dinuclear metal center hexameric protein [Caldichromatium japonicum]QIK39066.1 Nif3-like dinuclear metal center hexameric protein [Caldichromatium japonicum]
MIAPRELVAYCDQLLDANRFDDYAPNGLQVEGERPIQRLVTGVSACLALLEAAIAVQADAILVHHGWFWKREDPRLIGIKGQRARRLLNAGLSLIAYHLPLDAHPSLGNNALLGRSLGVVDVQPAVLGNGLVWQGRLPEPMTPASLAEHLTRCLGRQALRVGREEGVIQQVGWCTGAGQGYLEQAAVLGVDAFISGELAEQTTHQARELDICYLAAGHHATERAGVQALGAHLAERFGLWHDFIEIDNPA